MPLRIVALPLLLLLGTACSQPRPNVVVILIDDLGWKDTGVYGSTFYQTPHIDRLAAQGVRFTQFYSAGPNCAPTRASIMTGRYPAGLHLTHHFNGRRNGMLLQAEFRKALPLEEVTIGEVFQAAGYTTGYVGKWHLGVGEFRAEHQGFDTVFASNNSGHPGSHFAPYGSEKNPATLVPDLQADSDSTYLTDRLTDAAVEFLQAHQEDPFLLVLSHYAVHRPLESKPEVSSRFESDHPTVAFRPELYSAMTREQQGHAVYAGMIASVDESVGRIMNALHTLRLAEHTIVVFTSDNGGLSTLRDGRTSAPTAILPLRAGKGGSMKAACASHSSFRATGLLQAALGTPLPLQMTCCPHYYHSLDYLQWRTLTGQISSLRMRLTAHSSGIFRTITSVAIAPLELCVQGATNLSNGTKPVKQSFTTWKQT